MLSVSNKKDHSPSNLSGCSDLFMQLPGNDWFKPSSQWSISRLFQIHVLSNNSTGVTPENVCRLSVAVDEYFAKIKASSQNENKEIVNGNVTPPKSAIKESISLPALPAFSALSALDEMEQPMSSPSISVIIESNSTEPRMPSPGFTELFFKKSPTELEPARESLGSLDQCNVRLDPLISSGEMLVTESCNTEPQTDKPSRAQLSETATVHFHNSPSVSSSAETNEMKSSNAAETLLKTSSNVACGSNSPRLIDDSKTCASSAIAEADESKAGPNYSSIEPKLGNIMQSNDSLDLVLDSGYSLKTQELKSTENCHENINSNDTSQILLEKCASSEHEKELNVMVDTADVTQLKHQTTYNNFYQSEIDNIQESAEQQTEVEHGKCGIQPCETPISEIFAQNITVTAFNAHVPGPVNDNQIVSDSFSDSDNNNGLDGIADILHKDVNFVNEYLRKT